MPERLFQNEPFDAARAEERDGSDDDQSRHEQTDARIWHAGGATGNGTDELHLKTS